MQKLLTISMLLIAGCCASEASIIFTLGNNPSNEVNILLNSGATGATVTGSPNGFPGVTVDFTSTETLLEPSSGQARVTASTEGTPLTNLTVSLANGLTYDDLMINPFIGGQCPTCTGGAATITVHALNSMGQPETPSVFTNLTVGNGNNFLTIVATGGESIVSTSISVPGGINDLRQPRISGSFTTAITTPTPEPATYALMLLGAVALFVIRGRLRVRSNA